MKFWFHVQSEPEQLLDIARIAEDCGFEGILDGEHWATPVQRASPYPYTEGGEVPLGWTFLDLCVSAAAVTVTTERLKFGSSVYVLPNRDNPIQVAKAVSSASILGGNRFIFGVAGGWMKDEFDIAGIEWSTRTRRMEEMIEILRKLWGRGPVEHHGEFFDFEPLYSDPSPMRQIPIWIGGHAPAALRRAGRIGDGYMGTTAMLEEMPAMLLALEEGRREADSERRRADFPIMIAIMEDHSGTPESMLRAYTTDNYRRMEEMGITDTFIGPLPRLLGKRFSPLSEKRRLLEDFANQCMR